MRIAFDMSSVMWTGLLVGKDREGADVMFEDKVFHVNTAAYGYENCVNLMVKALNDADCVPMDCTLVFEGQSSKRRRVAIDPNYKVTRSGRPDEAYVEFGKLREQLEQTWLDLGANTLTQDNVEGDDLLAWLAFNAEEPLTVVSNDGDLMALHGKNGRGVEISVRVNGEVGINKFGPFEPRLITTYKALVGDSSDNIKGCPGFGKAAFLNLVAKYGEDGLAEMQDLLEAGSLKALESLPDCAILHKILGEQEQVLRCYRLAKMHPEWCDTAKLPVQWRAGMVKKACPDERLRKWSGKIRLVGAKHYEAACQFLKDKLADSRFVAFDIETSTPDESSEWLDAQGNPEGVDPIGSELTGFALTFGANSQFTYYVSVDHTDSDNITMVQARQMQELVWASGLKIVIQNFNFEGPVLYQAADEDGTLWRDHWKDNGYRGFIPNMEDTKIMASYVNENEKAGLKHRSALHLGYAQTDYKTVTTIEGKQHKMHELTAQHVLTYGADDGITTAALYNWYKLHMQLEHHYQVYRDVEIDAAYLHALSYVTGIKFSVAKCKELEKLDDATYEKSWAVVRTYLIDNGWEGSVCPVYSSDITAKQIKEAYALVTGQDAGDDADEETETVADKVLSSRVRTPLKLVALMRAETEQTMLADLIEHQAMQGHPEGLNDYIKRYFKGEPKFKFSSNQLCHLLYDVMKLTVKVRNKVTDTAKANGAREGNPKADMSAFAYALIEAKDGPLQPVLESLRLLRMVLTRKGLYYNTYPNLVHWKTGLIHSSHNICSTNTRRASSSGPNIQQLEKTTKIDGEQPRFRETFLPHKPGAVVVSMDVAGQEMRLVSDYSRDPNMLACFIGDSKRDMHNLTALSILKAKYPREADWTYELVSETVGDKSHPLHSLVKEIRAKSKAVNFGSLYSIAAPKLAVMLLISESDAQAFLDAKMAAFPVLESYKSDVIDQAKRTGVARTKLGAIRHLAPLLNSSDKFTAAKAERQAWNFLIQSSSAEQIKLVEKSLWKSNVLFDFDMTYMCSIHDETVCSVMIKDLPKVLSLWHSFMVQLYADMVVPLASSISFGKNFGEQIEAGLLPTEVAIGKALVEGNLTETNGVRV